MDLPLGASDLLAPVKQRGESGVLVPAGVPGEDGVGLEHRFEPLTGVSGPVPDLGQVREVGCDLGEDEPGADEETTGYPPPASGTITPGDRDDFDQRASR
jgi:hypothetical protein